MVFLVCSDCCIKYKLFDHCDLEYCTNFLIQDFNLLCAMTIIILMTTIKPVTPARLVMTICAIQQISFVCSLASEKCVFTLVTAKCNGLPALFSQTGRNWHLWLRWLLLFVIIISFPQTHQRYNIFHLE